MGILFLQFRLLKALYEKLNIRRIICCDIMNYWVIIALYKILLYIFSIFLNTIHSSPKYYKQSPGIDVLHFIESSPLTSP